MTVAVIDYQMGNIQSIVNALEIVTDDVRVVSDGASLDSPSAIVLPGVGSFADGMANLREQGFLDPLQELVYERTVPYLGICLGLQFLMTLSRENGIHDGLDWISGEITRLSPADDEVNVPHMGWNSVTVQGQMDSVLFRGFDNGGTFYFVHSYHLDPTTTPETVRTATTWHGQDVTAAVRKDNVFGVQFHPEKSQGAGLRVLENFVAYANGGDAL